MRVVTLQNDDFKKTCEDLSSVIKSDFIPDVIVGILTGGGYVGREVSKDMSILATPLYTEIRIQRKDTKKKGKGVLHKILQILPYFILNWLRMAEMLYEDIKGKKIDPKREGTISFSEEVSTYLQSGIRNVLIVDDAIDTGATLKMVKDFILEKFPCSNVKIAVITVTGNHPLIDADYCLFHNRTLVRFPWSNDFKKEE